LGVVRSGRVRTAVYEEILAAGTDLGLRNAGYYAVDSLRLEKGYRAWGRELTPDVNPFEAGLAFAVNWDKGTSVAGPRSKRCAPLAVPQQ